jgi:glucan biosynthesis protein C
MRYHYMDSMRSVLMVLGIVFHAAIIFSPKYPWYINDPCPTVYFYALTWFIHVFRMPTFFVISGFFAHFLLKRYRIIQFLNFRARRVFVPMLSAAVILITPQIYMLRRYRDGRWPSLSGFLFDDLPRVWLKEVGASHLWFLVTLIVYSVIAAVAFKFLGGTGLVRRLAFGSRISSPTIKTMLLLATLALYDPIVGVAMQFLPKTLDGGILFCLDTRKTIDYAPFFAFGVLLYENAALERCFLKLNPGHFLMFAGAALIYMRKFMFGQIMSHAVDSGFELYDHSIVSWVLVVFCFNFFMRFCNREHPFARYMSDASYSIYLFHHIFIIAFGMAVIPMRLPSGVKFLMIVTATTAITMAIHHFLILRFNVLRLLFNGKANRVAPKAAPARAPAMGDA